MKTRNQFIIVVIWLLACLSLPALADTGPCMLDAEHEIQICGGDGGGEIVASGTPEDIVKAKRSYTGAFLKPVLERGNKKKRSVAAE